MAASSIWESLTCANIFVVLASVTGFIERRCRHGLDYVYVVEVSWSDGRTTYVKRTYEDFLNFHKSVIADLRGKCSFGRMTPAVFVPNLKGKKLFQRSTRNLAENREFELHTFVGDLLTLNQQISGMPVVIDFFEPRSTDPRPRRWYPVVDGGIPIDIDYNDNSEIS